MKKLSFLFAVLLATGCASTGPAEVDVAGAASAEKMSTDMMNQGATDYAGIVAEAKAEQGKAKKAGGEWRDIGKFLKEAEKAQKAGDKDKALKLAKKARFQARMGQSQASGEAKAGPWLF